jgi:hypothetical protein
MDSDIWLPLVTLVAGWALAQVTEVLRDRRTTTRDRLARRAELQRTTLLEVQDALVDLWWGVLGSMEVEVGIIPDEQGPWKPLVEASRSIGATRRRVNLLASRVEDERARELITALVRASMELEGQLAVDDFKSATRTLQELRANYRVAIARIGELLWERY